MPGAIMVYVFFCLTVIFLVTTLILWRKYATEKEKVYSISESSSVDLYLATTDQIIKELVNRPNYSFVLIEPHDKEEQHEMSVDIHTSNLPVELALDSLKVSYHGLVEAIKQEQEDDDEDDDDDEEF
jgi:uncharacterized membrane protein